MEKITYLKSDEISDLILPLSARGMDLNLERMKLAIRLLGKPCNGIPAIQIAGTNGKGSITSFLESFFIKEGLKVGITTSPHLLSWCERIKIDGKKIAEREFKERLIKIKSITREINLTPFELVIATALDHFSFHKVKLMVLEVGLGGRFDATTAHQHRPLIGMASIGLDHCEHLGTDLRKIAKEKAAIIESESIVVSAMQSKEVMEIFEETVAKKKARLRWVKPISKEWDLGIPGEIQRKNAAVAKGILEELSTLGLKIKEENIRESFGLAKWPGRLQRVTWKGMPLVLDSAHNPAAAAELSKERLSWFNQEEGIHWIVGIQRNKDASSILRHLMKPKDSLWIVPITDHNYWTKENLVDVCPEIARKAIEVERVEEILEELLSAEEWPQPAPVITGSIYLLGNLLSKNIFKDD